MGDITLAGLVAPNLVVRMSTGTGDLAVGLANGGEDQRLVVGRLAVPMAGAALVYGSIGGRGGASAASRIDTPLVGSPYFMNDTPWGPIDVIATVTATTAPVSVVPSTPGAAPLFTGVVDRGGVSPNILRAYASPQVLTVTPMAPLSSPAAPQSTPRSTSQAPTGPVVVPTPGEERDDLDNRKAR